MAVVSMRQLLEAGVHFGHQTRRWNPKMKRFILGERNGIYLIDLRKTLTGIESAYSYVRDLVADGGTILFVGTKKQTQGPVAEYAEACGMPYVNQRWLGGMLTNFATVSGRVKRMQELRAMQAAGDFDGMPKREALPHTRELEKLSRNLGGIANLDRLPDAIFVIDTKKEHIAVTEARKLGLPVVAVVDTNCDPDVIDYVIPGNDDAIRSGSLMCRVMADAVVEGRFIAEHRAPDRRRRPAPGRTRAPPSRRSRPAPRPGRAPAGARQSRSRRPERGQLHRQGRPRLRQATGAGMLDCKKALEEAEATSRRPRSSCAMQGLAGAAKRSDREASRGRRGGRARRRRRRRGRAALRDRLRGQGRRVRRPDRRAGRPGRGQGRGRRRRARRRDRPAAGDAQGEHLDRRVRRLVAEPGQVVDTYLHQQAGRGVNAVAVVLEGGTEELAHDIAVHIAFTKPAYLEPRRRARGRRRGRAGHGRRDLPQRGQARGRAGQDRRGSHDGWFKERVLLDQAYVKDEKQTIAGMLGSARIVAFAQVVIGA